MNSQQDGLMNSDGEVFGFLGDFFFFFTQISSCLDKVFDRHSSLGRSSLAGKEALG